MFYANGLDRQDAILVSSSGSGLAWTSLSSHHFALGCGREVGEVWAGRRPCVACGAAWRGVAWRAELPTGGPRSRSSRRVRSERRCAGQEVDGLTTEGVEGRRRPAFHSANDLAARTTRFRSIQRDRTRSSGRGSRLRSQYASTLEVRSASAIAMPSSSSTSRSARCWSWTRSLSYAARSRITERA
jgi:hypothetical protein